MPFLVVVLIDILIVHILVVAGFARERREAEHTTAFAASQSSRQSQPSSADLVETIEVLIRVLGHLSFPFQVGMLRNMTIVPPPPHGFGPRMNHAFPRRTSEFDHFAMRLRNWT